MFGVVKQLKLDIFCEVVYDIAKHSDTQEKFKEYLQVEISEKGLQQINEAALIEGHQPLSFSG